jgi:DedD protein
VERLVKERLVGAAVLLAAAVILIPEMLSGPKQEQAAQSATATDDAPTKTYTIDLAEPAQHPTSASDNVETTAAPPPESVAPQSPPAAQILPETAVEQNESKGEESPPLPSKPARQSQPDPSATISAPSANALRREPIEQRLPAASPAPLATERNVPTSKGWAIQLGSFSKADTAEHLAQQVRGKGRNAFVMPVKSGNGTLYRVRVGPFPDRAAAEALQRQLKGEIAGATVVAHP